MIYEIPCAPGGASRWTQTTALDGRDYQMTFDWHQRMGRWVLHLRDAGGVAIRTGMVLNIDVLLLQGVTDPRRPVGELVAIDMTNARDADPGFSDLGGRFLLLYLDAAELGR